MNDQVTDDVSGILLTDDQAESSAKLFNFDAYSDAFAEIIKSARTPFVIGIFGDWGCGKTSLMKTVEKNMQSTARKLTSIGTQMSLKVTAPPSRSRS